MSRTGSAFGLASARAAPAICRRPASTTSGFVGLTADDTTTTSASPTLPAAWPSNTVTPHASVNLAVTSDRRASEPLTA